jgi:hypothetical protein
MVAARAAKDRAVAALLMLAWTRLGRLAGQLQALIADFRAGRLPAAPKPRARIELVGEARRPPSPPRPHHPPHGFGWLLRLVPEAGAFGGQM